MKNLINIVNKACNAPIHILKYVYQSCYNGLFNNNLLLNFYYISYTNMRRQLGLY